MIQPNLSNLANTDNYLLFPISNNKEYEIFIIAKDSYLSSGFPIIKREKCYTNPHLTLAIYLSIKLFTDHFQTLFSSLLYR